MMHRRETAVCLFVRFMAVSFQGPQDRCCEKIHRRGREGGGTRPFRSLVRPVLFSLRSGAGKANHNNKEYKTDNDDRKNDDRTRKS